MFSIIFNEWEYNRAQWWPGVYNNWCGGGGLKQAMATRIPALNPGLPILQ